MSVTIGSIAAALSGIAGHAHRHWGDDTMERFLYVRCLSLVMLGIAIAMAVWAGVNFQRRAVCLEMKADGPYDSRALPILLTFVMITSMSVVFASAIVRLSGEPA